MNEHNYDRKDFIEDCGLYFKEMGLTGMAGRILGVLLIANPPEQSLDNLCDTLNTSKSSVSTTTRLLIEKGLIERVPSPLPRRLYYRFKRGGWLLFMRQRMALWSALHRVAEQGLALLQDQEPALKARLQEGHDLFSHIEDNFPALLQAWAEEHGHTTNQGKSSSQ